MYVNSKETGYLHLSLDANWSSLARWNRLSWFSPSWPLKQTETRLPHNWTLLAVLWLILDFSLLFLRLNVRAVRETESYTPYSYLTGHKNRACAYVSALQFGQRPLSRRPAAIQLVICMQTRARKASVLEMELVSLLSRNSKLHFFKILQILAVDFRLCPSVKVRHIC